MKTKEQIEQELQVIKQIKKQLPTLKYPCTSTALAFIQLEAQQEMLEWILSEEK